MLLGDPGIVGLRSWNAKACAMGKQLLDDALIQQFLDSVFVKLLTHSTEGMGNLVV